MASFSIDDVRDTLRADITHLITRIEESARVLADVPEPPRGEEGPSFRAIGDHGHAVYGTCALVDAESLALTARCLEKLATRGEEEVRLAAAHLTVARRLARLASEGAAGMREMLGLELDRRGDEAQWIALEWQGETEAALASLEHDRADVNGAVALAETDSDASAEVDSNVSVDADSDATADVEPVADFVFDDAPEDADAQNPT